MSQVSIVVDVPEYPSLSSGDFINAALGVVERIKRERPINDQIGLYQIATTNTGKFVTATTADLVNPTRSNVTRTSAAGGAAGDITVSGVVATSVLLAVVAVKDADQTVVDLTSEFTAATGKINNTGGTATTGYHLVVVYY